MCVQNSRNGPRYWWPRRYTAQEEIWTLGYFPGYSDTTVTGTNEAYARVKFDAQLKDQGWDVLNANAVRLQ